MLCGLTAHPFWGDEADTISAASRPPPQLLRLPGHVDAVHGLYYPIPPWYLTYPEGFARLRDLSLAQAGATLGHLYASTVPRAVLDRRERGVRRSWVVQTVPGQRAAGYLAPGFRLAREWHLAGGRPRCGCTKSPAGGSPPAGPVKLCPLASQLA
ncbi:MAG TPA: hypothetical protein VMH35_02115 [Streptosporangiaceae bacterium]|nr:hypothetical protein [Streptosporangiaceae bacterium]